MGILFEKLLAKLLFLIYDFIDTIGAIFNILTGTQKVEGNKTLLEVFVESAVSTKVLLGLCIVSVVIVGASMAVKTVKTVVKFKTGGEQTSHSVTVKQGFYAILSTVVCIFFVFLFIAFSSMLLNMVNSVIAPQENTTLAQNLFNLSVQQSYVLDESKWEERYVDYLDEFGNPVQEKDPNGENGLKWETDSNGNYILDDNGEKIPVYLKVVERYHPYLRDDEGNLIMQTGWVGDWTAEDISWSMTVDEVFGKHEKDWLKLFEQEDKGYTIQPMVRLEAFNLFTAYLVAIIMLISMFMLSIGLVKRIYDIIVLIICMPLVCGTIPLDDGARFRAWRETFMSKVLIAFGAVIAVNVFFMISGFIVGGQFGAILDNLISENVLSGAAVTIFRMLLLIGGAMCINGSQVLIARILGTSADESREAMQSFAAITSGVRLGAVGALGAGRLAAGMGRGLFGGKNRYGRERTGILNYAARGANAVGERIGGDNYVNSRGGAFVRTLGRMGNKAKGGAAAAAGNTGAERTGNNSQISQPGTVAGPAKPLQNALGRSLSPDTAFKVSNTSGSRGANIGGTNGASQPAVINNIKSGATSKTSESSIKSLSGGLREDSGEHKKNAYDDNDKRGKR